MIKLANNILRVKIGNVGTIADSMQLPDRGTLAYLKETGKLPQGVGPETDFITSHPHLVGGIGGAGLGAGIGALVQYLRDKPMLPGALTGGLVGSGLGVLGGQLENQRRMGSATDWMYETGSKVNDAIHRSPGEAAAVLSVLQGWGLK